MYASCGAAHHGIQYISASLSENVATALRNAISRIKIYHHLINEIAVYILIDTLVSAFCIGMLLHFLYNI